MKRFRFPFSDDDLTSLSELADNSSGYSVIGLFGCSSTKGLNKLLALRQLSSSQVFVDYTINSSSSDNDSFFNSSKPVSASDSSTDIAGAFVDVYIDKTCLLIYLNLVCSIYDTKLLVKKLAAGASLQSLNDDESEHVKSFLAMALLSHILVLVQPTANFCPRNVRFFRAVDSLRHKLQGNISSGLEGICSDAWKRSGRLCTPRLILFCQNSSLAPTDDSRSRHALNKKLQSAIEYEIYALLRKSWVLQDHAAAALLSVPAKLSFVYLEASALWNDHIKPLASGATFNDNSGRFAAEPVTFIHPQLSTWAFAAQRIVNVISGKHRIIDYLVDVASRWSDARCNAALPAARRAYQEGLPSHYTAETHRARLRIAMQVYKQLARGSATEKYASQLTAICESHWRGNRRLCETSSLSGHRCLLPWHDSTSHSSKRRCTHSCNCGARQLTREDPFNIKDANFVFYNEAETKCCQSLFHYVFPLNENVDNEIDNGMMNTESASGWRPHFQSWSLVKFSNVTYDYSNGLDLPAFIHGTNFLLPLDVRISTTDAEDQEAWPQLGPSQPLSDFTLTLNSKVNVATAYFGIEYECYKGTRFFMSGPDSLMKGHIGGDSGVRCLSENMPLYWPCTCRINKSTHYAQLLRIHVFCPVGASLSLRPRVKPLATCGTHFFPQTETIELTGGYWVLRLPYIYETGRGPILPPKDTTQGPIGILLQGFLHDSKN